MTTSERARELVDEIHRLNRERDEAVELIRDLVGQRRTRPSRDRQVKATGGAR